MKDKLLEFCIGKERVKMIVFNLVYRENDIIIGGIEEIWVVF